MEIIIQTWFTSLYFEFRRFANFGCGSHFEISKRINQEITCEWLFQSEDFQGPNNRYGQVAVTDFLEYLSATIPDIFQHIRNNVSTYLQCQRCKWISVTTANELLIKLYIPGHHRPISLNELITFNSETIFSDASGVHCAKCGSKTAHTSRREHLSDLLLFEIIRVSRPKTTWIKNCIPVTFPVNGIVLPGSQRKYNIIGTCNHRGSIYSGHWFTCLRMADDRWYELNDLHRKHSIISRPGHNDKTSVVIVLLADDKMIK